MEENEACEGQITKVTVRIWVYPKHNGSLQQGNGLIVKCENCQLLYAGGLRGGCGPGSSVRGGGGSGRPGVLLRVF